MELETKLVPLWAGDLKADGGAMFGVIPRVLWNKKVECDVNNFVQLTIRCLLIDQGERKILVETGAGDHYTEKFRQNQQMTGGQPLLDSLARAGYRPTDITDVLFTHLHWDHANGAFQTAGGKITLTFPKAMHWCSRRQWEHAHVSNLREKVTINLPFLGHLEKSGQLNLIAEEGQLFPDVEVRLFDGHTPGQVIPFITHRGKTLVYTADFIPTAANIPVLWIAAYDLFPVTVMEEKEKFLAEAATKGYVLFFEHDYYCECATVAVNEKGASIKEKIQFQALG